MTSMTRALLVMGAVSGAALIALFSAPPGRADPIGTLLRTVFAAALLFGLGKVIGQSSYRRPPSPVVPRLLIVMVGMVAAGVCALRFSPSLSIALAVWYGALFVTGLLVNRWCDAPERYTLLVATFVVFLSSVILSVISAASSQRELGADTAVIELWRNVARVAALPGDAAWMWMAWRVADRLRAPEAKRKKLASAFMTKAIPKRSV